MYLLRVPAHSQDVALGDLKPRTCSRRTSAWWLATLHFAFLLGVIAGKPFVPYPGEPLPNEMSFNEWHVVGDMVAARYFHHTYENILVQTVTIIDLPALAVGGLTVSYAAAKDFESLLRLVRSCVKLAIARIGRMVLNRAARRPSEEARGLTSHSS